MGKAFLIRAAGGLALSKLAKATATEETVVKGFTFFAGDKELKTGKAVPLETDYIFKDGAYNPVLTSRFAKYGWTSKCSDSNNTVNVTSGDNQIQITPSTAAGKRGYGATLDPMIDMTDISTVTITATMNRIAGMVVNMVIGFRKNIEASTTATDYGEPTDFAAYRAWGSESKVEETVTFTIDTSSLIGKYYFACQWYQNDATNPYIHIDSITFN